MADTNCTRAGCDSTGRYHVPLWRPPVSPVNIPLPLQERLLEAFLLDEWVEALRAFAERHRDLIVDMAFSRLRDGHELYGSSAYGWSSSRRCEETLQEIADACVYLSSGEVE